ncbi:MAG: hypothetical protein ACK4UN_00790 [Limisphaerales bacterium]
MSPILLAHASADSLAETARYLQGNRIENPVICVGNSKDLVDYLEGKESYKDRAKAPMPVVILLDQEIAGSKEWSLAKSKSPISAIIRAPDVIDFTERIHMTNGILLKRTRTGYRVEREAI